MKMFKSIISLMLALIMIFSCCSVALGAEEENYPQIHVAGFGGGCVNIYYEDDPEQKLLFFPLEAEEDEETLYDKIWKIFKAIVLFPKKILDKLFKK